jgi:hypothetical protein
MFTDIKAKLLYKVFQVMNRRTFGSNPLESPMDRQKEFLLSVLRRQAETEYGRMYDFAHIETIEEYQGRVPLTKYQDYEPYYERMKQGEAGLLFQDELIAWILTSGTTSAVKTIPLSDHMEHRLGMAVTSLYLAYIDENPQENLKCLSGKLLSIVGNPRVGSINGVPTGYVTGVAFAAKAKNKLTASMFTPTVDVLLEKDWARKYWLISQQAVRQEVSMITGLPLYVVDYLDKLDSDHKYRLGLGNKTIPEIWPNLKLMIWSGAKFGGYSTRLRELVGDRVDFRESYGSTETGLLAHQIGDEPGMAPVLGNAFIEFIPISEWYEMETQGGDYQNFEFTAHTFGDVEPGLDYVIVLTTAGGLYRYLIGDTVVFHQTDIPRFSWSGRTLWYTNVALERLTFAQVESAVTMLGVLIRCPISNFSYAVSRTPPRYTFVLETDGEPHCFEDVAALLDECLGKNQFNYQHCREDGVLLPPNVSLVPYGTYAALERKTIQERRDSVGQFKAPRYTDMETILLIKSLAADGVSQGDGET